MDDTDTPPRPQAGAAAPGDGAGPSHAPVTDDPADTPEHPGAEPDEPAERPELQEHLADDTPEAEEADRSRRIREERLAVYHGAHIDEMGTFTASAVSFGSGDSAHTITHNHYGGAEHPVPLDVSIGPDRIEKARATYEQPSSHDQLLHVLRAHGLAILRGPAGSGRLTTAILAAAQWREETTGHRGVMLLDWEGGPRRLLERDRLTPGHAFVMEPGAAEGGSGITSRVLRRLSGKMAEGGALVIVATTRDDLGEDTGDLLVEHHAPPLDRVVARHLTHGAEMTEGDAGLLGQPEVKEAVRTLKRVTDAVEIGRLLRRPGDPADLLRDLHTRRHERAARLLTSAGDDTGQPVWARALLISVLVLDKVPLTLVGERARDLARLLHTAHSDELPSDAPAFDDGLRKLLDGYGFEVIDEDAQHVPVFTPGCRVRVRDEGLARAVLEVLWHDRIGARRPLLTWLDRLVDSGDERIRIAAAQTAGLLATFDFEHVRRELFERHWVPGTGDAKARRRRHLAAAWALETAALTDAGAVRRVRVLVRRWANQKAEYKRAAMYAYGTRLGALIADDAVRGLGAVAGTVMSVRHPMREIYATGASERVIDELLRWSGAPQPALRGEAADCLLELARFRGTPQLTELMADPRTGDRVLTLTRRLLLGQDTACVKAWEAIRVLVEQAEDDPAADPALGRFLVALTDGPGERLREALLFHLGFWQHRREPGAAPGRLADIVKTRWLT